MPNFDQAYIDQLNKTYNKGLFVRAVVFTESTSPLVKKYWVDHPEPIVFQGNTYEPLRMMWRGLKASSTLDLEGAELSVSNLARKAEDYVETIDIKGNEVLLQLLHLSLLNTLTNFYQRRYYVQAVRADASVITFTIGRELGWVESEFDDAWAQVEQDYYNELVTGHNGNEERDLCDLPVLQRREGLEYLNLILAEGRASFIPGSGDLKWRYVIDRPRSPVMLLSEPGNIIESSIVSQPLQPDPNVNYMFAEYRDADNRDIPNLVSLPDPEWNEGDPIVSDAIKLETIRRESQADREAMYHRKKQALVRRHWEAQGLHQFLYAEPMQPVYFYYPTASHLRGYTGRIRSSNDAKTELILDRTVTLEVGETYQIVIQHESGAVETRTINTTAGVRIRVTVSVAFTTKPLPGTVYSLDKVDPVQRTVVFNNIIYNDEEPIAIALTDYVPEIYTPDALPPKSVRRFFDLVRTQPLPLRWAAVVEESAITRDGTHTSTLIFSVTPGLHITSGTIQTRLGPNYFILGPDEPARYDTFNQWELEFTEGTGAGEKHTIVDTGGARDVVLSAHSNAVAGTKYKLTKERFGELTGFKVERRGELDVSIAIAYRDSYVDLAALGWNAEQAWTHWELYGRVEGRIWPGPEPGWTVLDTYSGIRGEYRDRIEAGVQWFRFTPISNGVENRTAQPIASLLVHGDQGAPVPPNRVTLASHLKQVSIDVFQQRPTAEDLASFLVHWYRIDPGNVFTFLRAVEVPVPQDNIGGGELMRRHTHNFSDQPYGAVIWAAAAAKDRSGNQSGFVGTQNVVTLSQVVQGDIGPNAVTDIDWYTNDAIITTNPLDGGQPIDITEGALFISTTGRPIIFDAAVTIKNTDESVGGSLILEVKYHNFSTPDYGSGILLGTMTISQGALQVVRWSMPEQAWPAPGTYFFKMWMREPIHSVIWHASIRRFRVVEIRDKSSA